MALAFAVALENLKREGKGSRLVATRSWRAAPGLINPRLPDPDQEPERPDRPVRGAPGPGLAGSRIRAGEGPAITGVLAWRCWLGSW